MRNPGRLRVGRPLLSIVLLAIVAVIVSSAWLAEARHGRARKGKSPPAGSVDCKKDSECVAVVDDCCPCSRGGKQRAIPRKEKEAYEKARKKRCAGTACTEMMSDDASCAAKPFCGAGICELGDTSTPASP